ncbi:MAG: hypothetical protein LZ169_03065, partial [Thaumarchaeota archaeon]|nr:hypothetical protein [Candidatus Wolframiiraptor allenii]
RRDVAQTSPTQLGEEVKVAGDKLNNPTSSSAPGADHSPPPASPEQILYIICKVIIQALQGRIIMDHAGHVYLSGFNGLWSYFEFYYFALA